MNIDDIDFEIEEVETKEEENIKKGLREILLTGVGLGLSIPVVLNVIIEMVKGVSPSEYIEQSQPEAIVFSGLAVLLLMVRRGVKSLLKLNK